MRARDPHLRLKQVVEVRRLLRQVAERAAARAQADVVAAEGERDRQLEQLANDHIQWRASVDGAAIALHLVPVWQSRFQASAATLSQTSDELLEARRRLAQANADLARASGALNLSQDLANVAQARFRRTADERQLGEVADRRALEGQAR